MLPLSLLRAAESHPMLVELKNGETYNGHLVTCDTWMNINLKDVICTSREGDRFWRMAEVYIRGVNIKYLRIPDHVIDMVHEEQRGGRNRPHEGGKRPMINQQRGSNENRGQSRQGGGHRNFKNQGRGGSHQNRNPRSDRK